MIKSSNFTNFSSRLFKLSYFNMQVSYNILHEGRLSSPKICET